MSTKRTAQTTRGRAPAQPLREEILAAADAWYRAQMAILEKCHGKSWPEHEEWCRSYVVEQLRLRLIERGWRERE